MLKKPGDNNDDSLLNANRIPACIYPHARNFIITMRAAVESRRRGITRRRGTAENAGMGQRPGEAGERKSVEVRRHGCNIKSADTLSASAQRHRLHARTTGNKLRERELTATG